MIDEQTEVRYHDPHPGLLGCPSPLPHPIVLVAAAMEGSRGTLRQGLDLLEAVDGSVGVFYIHENEPGSGIITYRRGDLQTRLDSWRVIRFTAITTEDSYGCVGDR